MNEQLKPGRIRRRWRIAIALLSGLLIAALGLAQVVVSASRLQQQQALTAARFRTIEETIKEFRARHHRLPKSLGELPKVTDSSDLWEESGFTRGYLKANCDAWERPLLYTVRGREYFLTSYGADGTPGGIGLDHDLTRELLSSSLPSYDPLDAMQPTLIQRLLHPLTAGVRWTALICGVLTFLLTLRILRPIEFGGSDWAWVLTKMVCTLVAASFVAMVICLIDMPWW